jgi:hypothetical protein
MWANIPIYEALTKIPENASNMLDKSGKIVQYLVKIGANVDKSIDKYGSICIEIGAN